MPVAGSRACGIIPLRIMNCPHKTKFNLRSFLAISILIIIGPVTLISCPGPDKGSDLNPVFRDEFSFYIIDPGPFEVIDPELPDYKEFLILRAGDVEISCGIFPGVYLAEGAIEAEISSFAMDSIQNTNWLPGVQRWMLDNSAVTIDGRWFYYVTLLARRDPGLTSQLTEFQLLVHRRELDIYPDQTDIIVRIYYTIRDKDLYILTLSGPPEDFAARGRDVRRLLANIRLDATSAVAETQ